MNKIEKKLLQSIDEHGRGTLSESELFNSIGEQKFDKEIHKLISEGYIEEFEKEGFAGFHTTYRISAKGYLSLNLFYKKWWYVIISDIKTIIVSMIISLVTTLITIYITKIFNG